MMYNWDDLEVDDSINHNSRHFFARRRSKHELFEQQDEEESFAELLIRQRSKTEKSIVEQISGIALLDVTCTEPEEMSIESPKPEGSTSMTENPKPEGSASTNESPKHVLSSTVIKQEQNIPSPIKNEENKLESIQVKNGPKKSLLLLEDYQIHNLSPIVEIGNKENQMQQNPIAQKPPTRKFNLVTPSRFAKPSNGAIPKNTALNAVPAFQRLTAISTKREQLLKKQIDEEKKMREFHSRPMPRFEVPSVEKYRQITVPFTPEVLKRSRVTQKKRLEKLKELEEKYKPIPFKAHEVVVTKEEPFVPKHSPIVLETRPYNLRSDRRLDERKKFDEAVKRNLEEKKRQEEEERKKLEDERFKELRKQTVFKARPNPFNGKKI